MEKCEYCGSEDDVFYHDDNGYICEDCQDELYTCYGCGIILTEDNEHCDGHYCRNCY